jgi:hypothetical protein
MNEANVLYVYVFPSLVLFAAIGITYGHRVLFFLRPDLRPLPHREYHPIPWGKDSQ